MNYRKYLTENIMPFWTYNAIDCEKNGIFYSLDKSGNVTCLNKNLWFSGRALWSFANAYNTIEPKKEYLSACDSIYRFIKSCTLSDGRLPFVTDRNGTPLEKRNLFHGEAHAAMGFAAYYKACKDDLVKNEALGFFDIAYNMYMSGEARKETAKDNKERFILGRDMFALSLAQVVRSCIAGYEKAEILAKKAIENIINTGYINNSTKTVNEYVGCNGEVYDYSCYGHLYETAWFIMYEGEIKNDAAVKTLGKNILDYCLTKNNGKKFEAIPLGTTSPNNEFFWWPQCEAIIAYYLAYNIFKDKFYLDCAKEIENFAFKSFEDKHGSEWFSKCDSLGNILDDAKGSQSKGVFHLPRMLMVLTHLQEKNNIADFM